MDFKELIGSIVVVEFLDHVIGLQEPVTCRAYGELVSVRKKCLIIRYWECVSKELGKENDEILSVLSSTVVKVSKLSV